MHTLLKREKSWANTTIHRLTSGVTSRLFADIFAIEALEQKKKMGEEKVEERSKKRGGEKGRMPFSDR